MDQKEVIDILKYFLPGSFSMQSTFTQSQDGKRILERILEMSTKPINVTHFNQLLHLNHEAGVTEDFFKYYFLTKPDQHPYPVDKVLDVLPGLDEKGVSSLKQMEWGLRRFYIDALLYWGDIRTAYRDLRRIKSYSELKSLFSSKRYNSENMRLRGHILPFLSIPVDDRYLISEIACKAYTSNKSDNSTLIEQMLLEAYKKRKGGRVKIATLFDNDSPIAKDDPHGQMMLQFVAEEIMEEIVETEDDIRKRVHKIAERFKEARDAAIENTRLYLIYSK